MQNSTSKSVENTLNELSADFNYNIRIIKGIINVSTDISKRLGYFLELIDKANKESPNRFVSNMYDFFETQIFNMGKHKLYVKIDNLLKKYQIITIDNYIDTDTDDYMAILPLLRCRDSNWSLYEDINNHHTLIKFIYEELKKVNRIIDTLIIQIDFRSQSI